METQKTSSMRKEYDFTNSIKNPYVKKPKEKISMNNFSINDMLSMQKELQDKYKDKWEAIFQKQVNTTSTIEWE